ncbi:hypothetical protein C8J57DRAFT_1531820 [Mycena rebaudengoi]|nr:hypothetical protein C8J57DRAFT_1531820 [Mycena rebaudengoi]
MFPFTSHAQCPDQDIHIHADRAAFHAARDSDGTQYVKLSMCAQFYCLCRTIPMRIAKMLGRWVELCAQLSSPHTPLQRRIHFLFGPLNVAAPALSLLYCALRATHWMELFAMLHMMPAPRAGAFCSCPHFRLHLSTICTLISCAANVLVLCSFIRYAPSEDQM